MLLIHWMCIWTLEWTCLKCTHGDSDLWNVCDEGDNSLGRISSSGILSDSAKEVGRAFLRLPLERVLVPEDRPSCAWRGRTSTWSTIVIHCSIQSNKVSCRQYRDKETNWVWIKAFVPKTSCAIDCFLLCYCSKVSTKNDSTLGCWFEWMNFWVLFCYFKRYT